MPDVVLHIGMPKTGTKSVQFHLAPRASLEGWLTVTAEDLAWGFVGLHPQTGVFAPYEDRRWRNLAVASLALDMPLFVSAEQMCRATLRRVELSREAFARFDVQVVLTYTPLEVSLPRWVAQWCFHQGIPFSEDQVEEWSRCFLSHDLTVDSIKNPDVEGIAVRPEVVFQRWASVYPVTAIDVSKTDSVAALGQVLDLKNPPRSPRIENSRKAAREGFVTPPWLATMSEHLSKKMARVTR